MNQPQEIAEHLAHLIDTSAEKRVTGVVLGAALRLKYPDFRPEDYGALNLKRFIQTYASNRIEIAGRAGLDVVYTGSNPGVAEIPFQEGASGAGESLPPVPEAATRSETMPPPGRTESGSQRDGEASQPPNNQPISQSSPALERSSGRRRSGRSFRELQESSMRTGVVLEG